MHIAQFGGVLIKNAVQTHRTVLFFWRKMGYANPDQTAGGIHTRLFSRAFIVDDGSKRVVFVSADIGMVSQRLRLEVSQR